MITSFMNNITVRSFLFVRIDRPCRLRHDLHPSHALPFRW